MAAAALVQCTAQPVAREADVALLKAGEWQVRNQAALDLAVARPEAQALLAILVDGQDRHEPVPDGPEWSIGGGSGMDRVETLERGLGGALALPARRAPVPRILRTARDLVVPFTPRELALWVAGEVGVEADLLGAGAVTLVRTGTWAEQIAAADRLWRLGAAAASHRHELLIDPRTAGAMAHAAGENLEVSDHELAQVLRSQDSPAALPILQQVRPADCAAAPALAAAVLECCLSSRDEATRHLAARQFLDAGIGMPSELLQACDDPRRRERAVGLLLRLGHAARPAGDKLLQILAAEAVDTTTRACAALALAALDADRELAERSVQAILGLLARTSLPPRASGALLLALGGLQAGLPEAVLAQLADWKLMPAAHDPLAAFHALVRLGRVDLLTDAQLLGLAKQDFAGGSVARAAIARGKAGLGVLSPLLERGLWREDFAAAIGTHLAGEARRWLVGPSAHLRLFGARGLATLGADAGVDSRVLQDLLGDGAAEVRRLAARILVRQTRGAALDLVAASLDAGDRLELVLELPWSAAERHRRLLPLLREGQAWWWRHQALADDEVYALAVAVLTDLPQHPFALAALARVGPRSTRDHAWLLRALREQPTQELLLSLAEGPCWSAAWLPSLRALVRERGSPEDLQMAECAAECLWRHRDTDAAQAR
ncbi:MAG: hypothetical protein JNK49_04605 [Planctomycetes bacterium]|nr:hypothetical protein [Planctomycetota bacterium]